MKVLVADYPTAGGKNTSVVRVDTSLPLCVLFTVGNAYRKSTERVVDRDAIVQIVAQLSEWLDQEPIGANQPA